jgi:hypothetical protein
MSDIKTQRQRYEELELIFDSDSHHLDRPKVQSSKVWQAMEMIFHRSSKHSVAITLTVKQDVLASKNYFKLDSLKLQPPLDWSSVWKRIDSRRSGSCIKNHPRINCIRKDGYLYWYGYNPSTAETIFLESEDAAKSWLESYQLHFS